MASTGIPEFVQSLGDSRLLSNAQIRTLQQQLRGQSLNAESLAKILVRQKHLTEWQAAQLLKGQTGLVLEHYQLLNPVGRGGMGHVFRGRDLRDRSIVAVKVMARRLTDNQTLVSRFQREIKASSRLRSPNIVRTLDAGRVGKVDFMVMEFVNGDQVDRIANRLNRLPVGLACELIRQIADGLQHAHQHRMVHRDIKPSNMMVHWKEDGHGVAKLMDMGLVLLLTDNEDERTVTRAGQVMGTPDYMSPEQGWDTTKVDIRSDIYSLGCTLFRLLSGKIPFSGSNPLQVLSQRLQRDAPSLQTVCDDLPPGLVQVVERMTRRDPDARFQTPAEVSNALQPFAQPLQKSEFQKAAQIATSNPQAEISAPDSDVVDETDVTYQQFLAEVEDHSAVDLMLSTDENMAVSANTLPALDLPADRRRRPGSKGPGSSRKGRSSRRQKVTLQGLVAMGVLSAALLIIVLISQFWNAEPSPDSSTANTNPGPMAVPALPEIRFSETQPAVAQTGQLWEFNPVQVAPDAASVRFSLGETAPPGASIDAGSGQISWSVPESQTPGDYSFFVHAHHGGASANTAAFATHEINVRVEIGWATIRLPDAGPFSTGVGEEFFAELSVLPFSARELPLKYQLEADNDRPLPEELALHPQTGTLSWQPLIDDLGRHQLLISVLDEDNEVLDEATVEVLVAPTDISHVLATLPPASIAAGEVLTVALPLPDGAPPQVRSERSLAAGPDSPAGLTVLPDSNSLTWTVPPDAIGNHSISLMAAVRVEPGVLRQLNGVRTLDIQVTPPTTPAPDVPRSSLPDRELVEPVLTELQQTWRPRLAAARTPQQKANLGWELLQTEVKDETAVALAARLQLIEEELARPARAADLLLQIVRQRHKEYQTALLQPSIEVVGLFRRSGLAWISGDLLAEQCLQLSVEANDADDAVAAANFLKLMTDLSRGNQPAVGGPLLQDVQRSLQLCDELQKEPEAPANEARRTEIGRLLNRWTFSPVFQDESQLSFFGIREAGSGPVNGRGYWKFSPSHVSLQGVTLQAAVGFMTAAPAEERFVVRMDVAPDSTPCSFVIGATGTGNDFAAYGVVIDRTGPGRIVDVRNRSTVAEPTATGNWWTERWNRIEVVVEGTAVRVTLNGSLVNQVTVPMLQQGRIGLSAALGVAEPKVSVRNLRLLDLPAAQ